MSRLVVLTNYMGTPVAVNPTHVTEVHQRLANEKHARVDILMVNGTVGDDNTVLTVRGTFEEIVALLNAAMPQLHPSMMMPPAPAPWAPKPAKGGEA